MVIIDGGTVLTMDGRSRVLKPGHITIRGAAIESVLPGRAAPIDGPQRRSGTRATTSVINAEGKLILPGLVNCHTHASEILLRGGPGSGRSLYDWQWNLVYPAIRRYLARDVYVAALLFAVDSLRSGTTTFVDNANSAFTVDLAEAAMGAYREAGVRAVLAPVFAVAPVPEQGLLQLAKQVQHGSGSKLDPGSMFADLRQVHAMLDHLMRRYNGGPSELLRVWPAPHKPNRTSVESIQLSHELAERYGGMVSQPCSEIEAEQSISGQTAVEFLRRHGALGPRSLLGHCVHVSDDDIEAIAQAGARVAHLPVANLYLGSGIAPIPQMLSAGVTVGLGTDNANCNNSASILREMSVAALIHKGVTRQATTLGAVQALAMSTIGAATAIGREHLIGSIEEGKRADIMILDAERASMTPLHDPAETIVYQASGAEIDTVIVDGRIVLRSGELAFLSAESESELRAEAQRRSTEILRRSAIG